MDEKKTPLYDAHIAHGGKMVPFAGYSLPVEYEGQGVIKEHMAVRTACGIFDVSHMGEVIFKGPDALKTLNHLMANDMSGMPDGRCRYSPMCYPDGGCVDDTLTYRYGDEDYLVVVNAANREKDVKWMSENIPEGADVVMEDISDSITQIALQGPLAEQILAKIADQSEFPVKNYTFKPSVNVAGFDVVLSRTGYTGEDGFEIYCDEEAAIPLYEALLEAGKDEGLIPCGLGARDTLRLEAAMPLYGHEMDATINPVEAGLGFFVKLGKDEFIGKEGIEASPCARERIGLAVKGRGIVREHMHVYKDGKEIGITTSGTYMPYLKKACAMALVDKGEVAVGDEVEVEVRGRMVPMEVIPLPFYKTRATTSNRK
ncbi:MAG: glycine cleavage system aminomethyltransferase GcvT [bacterium]|nr:glycine cleavage system aminomethyltransferase GcvT [bacterium]